MRGCRLSRELPDLSTFPPPSLFDYPTTMSASLRIRFANAILRESCEKQSGEELHNLCVNRRRRTTDVVPVT